MSQADLIRACAKELFVDPARRRNQETLVIVAGEIGRELGLSNRMPNICNALQSRKFLEMAGVELLDPKPTKPAASARFSYAIKQKGRRLAQPNHADVPVAPPAAGGHHQPAHRSTEPHGPQTADFTLVIPCAARKQANAGRLLTENGTPVHFVANPATAPHDPTVAYRRPDDTALSSLSWRQVLQQYNETYGGREDNPLGLLPAWQLYEEPTYGHIADRLGEANVFILSAGWGLIPASFLVPNYDITLANSGEDYVRRRLSERWDDFAMLPKASSRPIMFCGGKNYVPLFCELTAGAQAERIVYHVGNPPHAPNCRCKPYETLRRTNWHYECARWLLKSLSRNS